MRLLSVTLTLLLASAVAASPPALKIPAENKPVDGYVLISPSTDAANVLYISLDGVFPLPSVLLKDPKCFVLPAGGLKPGKYRFIAVGAKDGEMSRADFAVVIDSPPSPPEPPTPPTPPPPPVPPAPIAVDGFRVLIVYESADLPKMPAAQQEILFGQKVRDYLRDKCVTGADGKTKEFRIWDKDIAVEGDAKHWQDAMARKRDEHPWLIISNGKTGYEGKLPADENAFIELAKKYEVAK